ncbi:MAG: hypothetical protein JWO99_742 [Candidatus Saccharibacteria bacterium]|nr:hypothetical protein [Candidatus Saccharibacteria bacterium]
MKNANVSSLLKLVGTAFRRFHLTMFIVFIVGCLGYAVISFSTLLSESSTDTSYTSPIDAGSIDQATLERINALHTSDDPTPAASTPAGRINPFSE